MSSFKVKKQDIESDLHEAAKSGNLQLIRKILYDSDCDPNSHNKHGKTAAFMYFINLLNNTNGHASDKCLTTDEIDCFKELLAFTYDPKILMDSQANEIFDMIDYCVEFKDVPLRKLYLEIVNYFISPTHPRQYFVQKILKAKLPSDYCLIALLFEKNELLNLTNFDSLTVNFVAELFTLFMVDEPFFNEYLPEVISTGWTFNMPKQSWAFIKMLIIPPLPIQTPFSFIKCLIQYDIDLIKLLKMCRFHLPPNFGDNFLVNVFVPLSTFVNAQIDLSWTIRSKKLSMLRKVFYYNFNESENILNDFRLTRIKSKAIEVVSLKNLARMSVRKYLFHKHNHYKALSILYSLHIPIDLRNFLCYNMCNLKF